ncbi:MAG: hypothetical protein HYY81_02115 [Deltaproteobacteria bacterium]|nr:hypothetical protein [Deltaproteobacteria bacterium]
MVVASPYPDNLTKRVGDFLTASGFQVLKAEGLGIELNSELANQPDHAAYRIARRVYFSAPDADGIFLPCNRWPTVSTIDLLERETGKAAVCALPPAYQGGYSGIREPARVTALRSWTRRCPESEKGWLNDPT